MKSYKFIVLLFFLSSCNQEWGEYDGYKIEYDNALDYYLSLNKVDTIIDDYTYYNKGAFIKYIRNDSVYKSVFVAEGGEVIKPYVDVDKLTYVNNHLLIAQKPLDSICECNLSCFQDMPSYDEKSYKRCEIALKKSTFYQYWIIDNNINHVYGPLNEQDYNRLRNKLLLVEMDTTSLSVKLP